MDGKIFLYSNGTLPRIAFPPDAFTFDLQRFTGYDLTSNEGETTTYTINNKTIKKDSSEPTKYFIEGDDTNTKYNSLEEAAVAAVGAKFLVTTKSGGTETTKYYDAADDFNNENLTTSDSGASITAIKVYGDVNLQDATTVTSTITVEKSAKLDLKGKTLTFGSDVKTGIKIKNSTDSANPIVFTLTDSNENTKGKVIGTYDPIGTEANASNIVSKAKKSRYDGTTGPLIFVGESEKADAKGSTLTVEKGVTVESNNGTICGTNNSTININDSTVQSYMSSAIYLGSDGTTDTTNNTNNGGGQTLNVTGTSKISTGVELTSSKTSETINGVEITKTKNSNLPAIQVSGNYRENGKIRIDKINNTNTNITCNHSPINITIQDSAKIYFNNNENDLQKYATDDAKKKYNKGDYIGNPSAIYIGGYAKLTVKGNVEVTSGGTGIEMRSGELEIPSDSNVEVKSTATTYKIREHGNSSGSTTFGAAIAISQHTTNQNVTTNVASGNFEAPVAFVVENPQDNPKTSTIEANLTGGTYESTDATAAIAAKSSDGRATVKISDVTFVGNLEDAVAETSTGTSSPAFTVTGKVIIAKKEDDKVVPVAEYDAGTATLTYQVGDTSYTVQEGWYRLFGNQWLYFVADSTDSLKANAIANLQPAKEGTGEPQTDSETTLELTYTAASLSEDSILALDMTSNTFKDVKFTMLDASKTTPESEQNKFHFNITGNDSTASIIGGVGDDTIKAIHSVGAFLNGGVGDDLLIGGDGADTYAFSGGSDTIQGYVYGTDAVSLGEGFSLPETFAGINNSDSSNFVLAVGEDASLTFRPTTSLTIAKGDDTFSYTASTIAKNDNITLGAGYTSKEYDGRNLAYQVIDASQVTTTSGINLRANDNASTLIGASTGGALYGGEGNDTLQSGGGNTTLNGGAGSDSLVGSESGADVFIYDGNAGGTDTVSGYGENDLVNVRNVRLSDAEFKSETTTESGKSTTNISLSFGGDDNLIFQDVSDKVVSVRSGSSSYIYNKNYYAHNKGVTLASGYNASVGNVVTFNGADENYKNYETINAAAVNVAISVMGNSLGNYIFGSTGKNATLNGGAGNDKLNVNERGTEAKYLFEFTEGKDEVIGFDATKDTVSVAVDRITAAKLSNGNSKLTLTVNKNKDVLTLRSEDEIEKVSLQSGGYLTKDGYVSGQGFSLFGSAKGQIDLNDALYKGSNISLVAADSVKSQGVTLVGSENLTDVAFAANNKKRDGFVYGGGNVTISGYEAGRDRIDLGSATLTSFDVVQNGENKDVALRTSNGVISILGAGRQEVLLHDTSKGNGYKKMVFAQTGVIENKQKNPTMATVSGSPYESKYIAGNTIKKIYVTGLDEAGVSIQAGGKNNTQIDASNAGKGVSLSGGAKNDKLIGSDESDLFVYSAGKDVIQGYSGGDSIKIGDFESSLSSAKITAGSKSIKFQFNNKNTLTIKANKDATLDGALTIGDTNYTYTKNAIESGGQATLTNAFSGTFDTANHKVTTVNGSAVSKNLTYKGSEAAESLVGGTKKTTFKGAGGQDSLVGGTGKDVFFYAKGDAGTTTIANFDFGSNGRAGNDKLKIASGTIGEISTIEGGGVQFAMNSGKKGDTSNIGWFQIKSGYNTSTKEVIQNIDASKVAIKANNTYYWFAPQDIQADDGSNDVLAKAGQLITSDSRVSASDVSGYDIIDLNYSTNLAKSGVAVKVTSKPPTKSNSNS